MFHILQLILQSDHHSTLTINTWMVNVGSFHKNFYVKRFYFKHKIFFTASSITIYVEMEGRISKMGSEGLWKN